jgi:hypothetical protein
MTPNDRQDMDQIDWSLTTWEGARREQLRRWAELPLERIIMALEEMEELTHNSFVTSTGNRPPGFWRVWS